MAGLPATSAIVSVGPPLSSSPFESSPGSTADLVAICLVVSPPDPPVPIRSIELDAESMIPVRGRDVVGRAHEGDGVVRDDRVIERDVSRARHTARRHVVLSAIVTLIVVSTPGVPTPLKTFQIPPSADGRVFGDRRVGNRQGADVEDGTAIGRRNCPAAAASGSRPEPSVTSVTVPVPSCRCLHPHRCSPPNCRRM